jgi:uncharacterized protein
MSLASGSGETAGGRLAPHLRFPLRLDTSGRTALADDERYLKGLVEQVLFTRPGERVNRPDFGSGIDALVFTPAGDELASATQALVHGAVQRHLGELIQVDKVEVVVVDATLEVTVVYTRLRAPSGEGGGVLRVSGSAGAAGGMS